MSEAANLKGETILVVEDEYFLAADAARSLAEAGACVLGPCANREDAFHALADHTPSAALLDLNLGNGADFTIAESLTARGIPFVFMTGYDLELIPPEFASVPRLQKPARLQEIIDAFETVFSAAGAMPGSANGSPMR